MIKRKELLTIIAYATPLLALLAVCFWLTSLDFGDFRPESSTVTYVLWALSTCVVLGAVALGFLLFRNLLKLYIERRGNVVGSRLKTKLVMGVLALSILPIAAAARLAGSSLRHLCISRKLLRTIQYAQQPNSARQSEGLALGPGRHRGLSDARGV